MDQELTGYEIRWRNPKNHEEGRVVVITYKIREGNPIYFGGYSLEHVPKRLNQELNPPERVRPKKEQLKPVYTPEMLLGFLEYGNDYLAEIFDETRYFRDRGSMQDAYARQGYVFAQIQPQKIDFKLENDVLERYASCKKIETAQTADQKKCQEEANWLPLAQLRELLHENPQLTGKPLRHIHFSVSENTLAYVENIIIRGNEKTKEYVIRREILIKEGQLFNSALVTISRQRLINLQYFSEVNLQMRPGSAQDKMNIVFEVKEQPTGIIRMGGTYGVNSGFALNMELGENNLQGTGQSISGGMNYGPNQRRLNVNWNEPWFYERCEDDSGPFWKQKQKAFDESPNLDQILVLAETLQNNHTEIGNAIRQYVTQAQAGDRTSKNDVQTIDRIKQRIRELLARKVWQEETCFRTAPKPWSLGIGASFTTSNHEAQAIQNSAVVETAAYEIHSFGLSAGTSHALGNYWSHYHRYNPQWSVVSNPSALAPDRYFILERQGAQFQSTLVNGLFYSDLDNSFTPTSGQRNRFEMGITGSIMGGDDHFNRYTISGSHYWWWFDFGLGGLFVNKNLRRWRIVQELTFSATFTQETYALHKKQDKEINPFIDTNDVLYLGGPGSRQYGRLRGYAPH